METLNGMIAADTSNLGRGYRIGHSFFVPAKDTVPNAAWYRDIVRYEVLPLAALWVCGLHAVAISRKAAA